MTPKFGQFGRNSGISEANAVIIQPDGRIVVAGTVIVDTPDTNSFHWEALIARYLPDGSLDGSFGSGGSTRSAFGSGDHARSEVRGLVRQPDGKFVVVGEATIASAWKQFLARYSADGRLDSSFGTGGFVYSQRTGGSTGALALQRDGKIVVSESGSLVRYMPDGSLDASFGRGGKVATSGDLGGIALQPDGRIVVFLSCSDVILARYLPNGTLDRSFGSAGKRVPPCGSSSISTPPPPAVAMAVQRDGRIVVAGTGIDRYTSTGARDRSFGENGSVHVPSDTYLSAVALQPDGEIVVAGTKAVPEFPQVFVDRYSARGDVDCAIGACHGTGQQLLGVQANALALQPDGKIVIAGTAGAGGASAPSVMLARFLGGPGIYPPPMAVSLRGHVASVRRASAAVRLSCSGGDPGALCVGNIRLSVTPRHGHARTAGDSEFAIGTGTASTVRVYLSRAIRQALRTHRLLASIAHISLDGGTGATRQPLVLRRR